MNKRSLRSFAFGIFMTVSIIGCFSFFQKEPKQQESIPMKDAKALLEKSGYVILPVTEYEELQKQTPIQEKEEAVQNVQEADPSVDSIKNYQLEITEGLAPNDIAAKLAENQIIKNEKEFTDFLINQNYHTKIQLGSFPLTNQMSYQQIADIITKR
ncbi:hypothetical protein [Niallia oryzisoli]|uniref:hypothetical protein n=1 Tax=Niallia oryzisoli TaxID=1737571 RepID=UPI0037364531